MILPDVNVLVYAFRREAARHDDYAGWLSGVAAGADELALADTALSGFLRIVTHPRIMSAPAPMSVALGFVEALRTAPRARPVAATGATWRTFAAWAERDEQLRGNLVPDAWLAALARSHGARLATADRGFARFPKLDWFIPVG